MPRSLVSRALPSVALPAIVVVAAAFVACATDEGSGSADFLNAAGASSSGAFPGPAAGIPVVQPGGTPQSPPPEVEVEQGFERPAAGRRFVYSAVAASDRVAVIDSTALAIESVEAGDSPQFLQTLAGEDAAIVLNVDSSDATIVRTTSGGSVTSTLDVVADSNAIAVSPDGAHAIVYYDPTLPGGRRSGSFQDISVLTLKPGADESTGMTVGFKPSRVSFDDDGKFAYVITEAGVSIIDFDETESRGAHIARTVSLGEAAGPEALDVSVTNDGRYALARPEGEARLVLVSLDDGERFELDLSTVFQGPVFQDPEPEPVNSDAGLGSDETAVDSGALSAANDDPLPGPVADAGATPVGPMDASVPDGGSPDAGADPTESMGGSAGEGPVETTPTSMPTPPAPTVPAPATPPVTPPVIVDEVTDLDLSASSDFAVAVVRSRSTAFVLDIPRSFTEGLAPREIHVEGEFIGSCSLTADGTRALLYTTADPTNERLTIVDLEGESPPRVVELRKSIRSVTISEDGRIAMIVHNRLAGDPAEPGVDPDVRIDRSYGYSVLELASGFAKLETTEVEVGPFALVPDGTALFALFDRGTDGEVHRIGLSDFLVESLVLGSSPRSIGTIPGSGRVFVGQEHPDGRISFIDWKTLEVESVTGFELNSRIRE